MGESKYFQYKDDWKEYLEKILYFIFLVDEYSNLVKQTQVKIDPNIKANKN